MKEVISDQSSRTRVQSSEVGAQKRRLTLWHGLRDGLIIQILLGVLCAGMLDYGASFQMWSFAMAAYWPVAILTILRQSHKPISSDPYVLRWGFLMIIFFFSPLVSGIVWHYRGVL